MARIVEFEQIYSGNENVRGPVMCGYKIFANCAEIDDDVRERSPRIDAPA